MDYLKLMKDTKAKQEALLAKAKEEGRVFTDAEAVEFDGHAAVVENAKKMIDAQKAVDATNAAVNLPANGVAQPHIVVKAEKKWSGFGEFLNAVRCASAPGATVDSRLLDVRNQTGMNEGIGSEGGFLVETDHHSELLRRTYDLGALTSRVRKMGVGANANGMTINAVAEASRATGARWGGIQGYWLHEAGTKTPTMPAWRQIELKLKKLIGLCWATDELLEDTTALEQVITAAFQEEFAWLLDEAVMRGTGVGQPTGFLNSGALVTVGIQPAQPNTTIVYENIVNMWARMWARSRQNAVWLINQDCEPQLHTMSLVVGVGGVPVYLPAGGATATPYATLYGRPVIPVENASTLGAVGDICLVDLSQYLMIDKGGMKSASSIHVGFVRDEQVFRFVYRCDGASLWNVPLAPANGAGNTLSPFVTLAGRP